MNQILRKLLSTNALFAFLILFSPLIISLFILTTGQTIGIPKDQISSSAAWFYPYLQLVVLVYWLWYSVNLLGTIKHINKDSIMKYNKVIRLSKVVFIVFLIGFVLNSIIPRIIDYPEQIHKFIKVVSYILIVVPLFLFYALIYSFWILAKTLNDIYEKLERQRKSFIIICFLMPLTFGIIHNRIKHELN